MPVGSNTSSTSLTASHAHDTRLLQPAPIEATPKYETITDSLKIVEFPFDLEKVRYDNRIYLEVMLNKEEMEKRII